MDFPIDERTKLEVEIAMRHYETVRRKAELAVLDYGWTEKDEDFLYQVEREMDRQLDEEAEEEAARRGFYDDDEWGF